MENKAVVFSIIFGVEYFSGVAIFLGGSKTIDRIFKYPIKNYKAMSMLLAFIHPIIVLFFIWLKTGVNSFFTAPIYAVVMWLALTDRSPKSLLVSILGILFSMSLCYGASSINYFAYILFGISNRPTNMDSFTLGMVCNLIGFLVAIIFIIMLTYIGKGTNIEPISVGNMVLLTVVAYLFCEYMMSVSDKNDIHGYQYMMLGYIVIISAVVLSLKNSESRFYSRISRMNENYLNAQAKYYDSRQKADTEIRRIKHDMKNHMICINDLAKRGKYQELSEYISEINDMLTESDKSIHVGNDIADAIINEKIAKAARSRTDFVVTGMLEMNELAPIDICTILANLLDNAIEAAELLEENMRRIEISFKRNEHFILITVSNPNDRLVDVENTAKLDKTNHGFGISNVRRTVEKYGGQLTFECKAQDEGYLFTAEVVLPKKVENSR